MDASHNDDLPLMSNINDWRARHYMIHLTPDFYSKQICGKLIIFFDTPSKCELNEKCCSMHCQCSKETQFDKNTQVSDIILDCCDVEIKCVKEIKTQFVKLPISNAEFFDFPYWLTKSMENVEFIQDKWSLTVFIDKQYKHYCKVLFIHYQTKVCGNSLYWRKDYDGNLCFFTPGSLINNRSLLPCQDRPLAMSTWQAWIIIPSSYYVAMTGDDNPVVTNVNQLQSLSSVDLNSSEIFLNCFYYCTSMVLPISTIAIAAGKWKLKVIVPQDKLLFKSLQCSAVRIENKYCHHYIYPCHLEREDLGELIPLTFVLPESLLCVASHLYQFAKYCLKAMHKILGRHPFRRLEIVILPRCFANLGLASPNLIFISKTLLENDSSSHIRLAHEISHTWFGITIGAKDWQEEWLSEGFATFLENPIYALALDIEKMEEISTNKDIPFSNLNKYNNFFNLRSHLHYKVLLAESENYDTSLQASSHSTEPIIIHDLKCSLSSLKYESQYAITNALNSEKSFLQVHYMKGYFILLYLSQLVSPELFLNFLNKFCLQFHGQLITSNDFFDFYFLEFPDKKKVISKKDLFNNWLYSNTINSYIKDNFEVAAEHNELIASVKEHFCCWNQLLSSRHMLSSKMKTKLLATFKLHYSDQLVLLLEWFLEKNHMSHSILKQIFNFYWLSNCNADVRHRWCELVIKHDYPDIESIKKFLSEDQSMGVYLYGELIISNKKKLSDLARNIYGELNNELDYDAKKVIKSMIFG